jgi:hypothetical protein
MNEMKNLWRGGRKTNERYERNLKKNISLVCWGNEQSQQNHLAREGERERERVARASEFVCVSVRAQEISSSSSSSNK